MSLIAHFLEGDGRQIVPRDISVAAANGRISEKIFADLSHTVSDLLICEGVEK
jgi:hypothetical protein